MTKQSPSKPLWIPLKRKYFDAFKNGTKTIEYRHNSRQWTEKHIYPGRPVTLGCGYSGPRLRAVVTKFETRIMDSETYGPNQRLALIHLRVLQDDAACPRTGNLFAT
jgi:hypothetical protein